MAEEKEKVAQYKWGCPNCLQNFYTNYNFTPSPFAPRYCPQCGYDAYDNAPVNPLQVKEPDKKKKEKVAFQLAVLDQAKNYKI